MTLIRYTGTGGAFTVRGYRFGGDGYHTEHEVKPEDVPFLLSLRKFQVVAPPLLPPPPPAPALPPATWEAWSEPVKQVVAVDLSDGVQPAEARLFGQGLAQYAREKTERETAEDASTPLADAPIAEEAGVETPTPAEAEPARTFEPKRRTGKRKA